MVGPGPLPSSGLATQPSPRLSSALPSLVLGLSLAPYLEIPPPGARTHEPKSVRGAIGLATVYPSLAFGYMLVETVDSDRQGCVKHPR